MAAGVDSHEISRRSATRLLGLAIAGMTLTATTASAQESPPDGAATRTITTVLGEVTIPRDPQRVIVMENRADLEIAVALQLPIVGVGVWVGAFGTEDDYVNPWIPFTPGPDVTVFNTAEADLEAIIPLAPDLNIGRILYTDGTFGFEYETLSRIAPIIPVDHTYDDEGFYGWRQELTEVAQFLDRTSIVETVLAEYDLLVDDVRARHGEVISSSRIAILRFLTDGQLFVNTASPFASVLNDLGGAQFELPIDEEGLLSLEQSILLDGADGMVFWDAGDDWERVSGYDVWNSLSLVTEGRYQISTVMLNVGSVYAAMEIVRVFDALFTKLAAQPANRLWSPG